MEIPDTPVEVVEHVVIARRYGVCGKEYVPTLSAKDGVIGKSRIGVKLTSIIVTLAIAKRMPIRLIQKLLDGFYSLHISVGEIVEVLHRVAEYAREEAQRILREIRGSLHLMAMRQDGVKAASTVICGVCRVEI